MSTPQRTGRRPAPLCPIRPGEPCTLCQPGVEGPHDCGLVWLVRTDPELAEIWTQKRREERDRARAAAAGD